MIHPEGGKSRRSAPRWLDMPRGEAFWISVNQLPPEGGIDPWPAWLSVDNEILPSETARSGGRTTRLHGRRHPSSPDDPRLPSRFPASTGA
jgi:hypothetical protein